MHPDLVRPSLRSRSAVLTGGTVAASVLLLLASTGCHSTTATSGNGGTRVLFIGNSLTSVNDVPQIFAGIAAAGGFAVFTDMVVAGNASLSDHLFSGEAAAKIQDGNWDYVVMQQGPSGLPASRIQLIEATEMFASVIEANAARPALYMVWPDITRRSAFDSVSASYTAAADAVDGLLFPAGDAWVAAWAAKPGLALYGGDGFHPSPLGSYLAALTIYAVLCNRSPAALPVRPAGVNGILLRGTSTADLGIVQAAAASVTANLPRKGECVPAGDAR